MGKKKKRKKRKNRKRLLLLFIVLIVGISFYFIIPNKSFLKQIDNSTVANITYYDIYGIHMNFKGNIKISNNVENLKLILTNGKEEIDTKATFTKENNKYIFSTSKYINDGINLEKLNKGDYYLLIKGTKNNKNIYYSLQNKTDYQNLNYYTLTKNNHNNKIDINWDQYNNISVLNFKIKETNLPANIYDITIDPGHDINDSGKLACSDGSPVTTSGTCLTGTLYKESNINLNIAKELKNQLEDLGYKVKLTRTSKNDAVPTYGNNSSAETANQTKSKFNLALHHNSSGIDGGLSSLKGLELYVADNIDFKLSELFVDNIIKYANTTTSPKDLDKVQNGIYQRFFTEEELLQDDNKPATKTTNTFYYYSIREVGGIATGAYNKKNNYYNSNNTAESYLFELGYLDNVQELKNIISNKKGYAKGIAQAIQTYLNDQSSSYH